MTTATQRTRDQLLAAIRLATKKQMEAEARTAALVAEACERFGRRRPSIMAAIGQAKMAGILDAEA